MSLRKINSKNVTLKPDPAPRHVAEDSPTRFERRAPEPSPRWDLDESREVENSTRRAAGAGSGQTGYTCARCLEWQPAGSKHQCQPYKEDLHPSDPNS